MNSSTQAVSAIVGKHTPGDWIVQSLEKNHHGYDWPTFTVRSKTTNVCLAVIGEVDRYCSEQNEANVILMASAPELLAELKEARRRLATLQVYDYAVLDQQPHGTLKASKYDEKLATLIAKAEGRS